MASKRFVKPLICFEWLVSIISILIACNKRIWAPNNANHTKNEMRKATKKTRFYTRIITKVKQIVIEVYFLELGHRYKLIENYIVHICYCYYATLKYKHHLPAYTFCHFSSLSGAQGFGFSFFLSVTHKYINL